MAERVLWASRRRNWQLQPSSRKPEALLRRPAGGGRSRRQRCERTTAAALRRRERLTRAMATRLFCPPDSVYIGCAASSAGMPKLLSWARCTSSLCCK